MHHPSPWVARCVFIEGEFTPMPPLTRLARFPARARRCARSAPENGRTAGSGHQKQLKRVRIALERLLSGANKLDFFIRQKTRGADLGHTLTWKGTPNFFSRLRAKKNSKKEAFALTREKQSFAWLSADKYRVDPKCLMRFCGVWRRCGSRSPGLVL